MRTSGPKSVPLSRGGRRDLEDFLRTASFPEYYSCLSSSKTFTVGGRGSEQEERVELSLPLKGSFQRRKGEGQCFIFIGKI